MQHVTTPVTSEQCKCVACGHKFRGEQQEDTLCSVCARLVRLGVETVESLRASKN